MGEGRLVQVLRRAQFKDNDKFLTRKVPLAIDVTASLNSSALALCLGRELRSREQDSVGPRGAKGPE